MANTFYSGVVASIANSVQPNGPESQMQSEIGHLHSDVNELMQVVQLLDERLKPVQREESYPTGEDAVEVCLVPMADKIRTHRRAIQGSITQLRRVLDRLEV